MSCTCRPSRCRCSSKSCASRRRRATRPRAVTWSRPAPPTASSPAPFGSERKRTPSHRSGRRWWCVAVYRVGRRSVVMVVVSRSQFVSLRTHFSCVLTYSADSRRLLSFPRRFGAPTSLLVSHRNHLTFAFRFTSASPLSSSHSLTHATLLRESFNCSSIICIPFHSIPSLPPYPHHHHHQHFHFHFIFAHHPTAPKPAATTQHQQHHLGSFVRSLARSFVCSFARSLLSLFGFATLCPLIPWRH